MRLNTSKPFSHFWWKKKYKILLQNIEACKSKHTMEGTNHQDW